MSAHVRPGRLVARNFLALGSGEVFARMVAFGATIYLARTLGPAMYGVVGFAIAVLLYLSRVADFGIDLSGSREVAQNPARLQQIAPSVLTVRLLIAVALVLLTWAVASLLPRAEARILSAYSVTLLAVAGSTRWIYVGLERASAVAITRTIGEAVMALLVVLLVHGPADVLRAPVAQIAGDTVAAALLALWLRRYGYRISFALDWPAVRPLFRRAWPLVLSALLGLIIFNSGLIFLRFFQGSTTVGHYAAAYTLIGFLLNLGLSYRMSLIPTLTRLADSPSDQRRLYHSALMHLFAVALPISLGGFLLAPQIIELVFGPGYEAAAAALQILIWSVPLCLLRDVPSAALLAEAREDRFLRLTASGAVLNLSLNVLLIPSFGMTGAAISTIVTESLRLVLATRYVRRSGLGVLRIAPFGRLILAGSLMAGALLLFRPADLWRSMALGTVMYCCALVVLGAVRLRRGELPALKV